MSTKPPELFNLDVEAGLTGAALIAGRQVLDLPTVKTVKPSDFWSKQHAATWAAILKAAGNGAEIDQTIIADELQRGGKLGMVGGAPGLLEMVNACESWPKADSYAAVVLDWSRQRRARKAISDLGAALGKDGTFDAQALKTWEALGEIITQTSGPVQARTMSEIREYFGDVAWVWPSWLPVGHLSMVAGPQGCGKSYLAARLIATISGHYDRWPDGIPLERCEFDKLPAKVLLVETEEMRGVYAERLEKMGVGAHWVLFGPGDETHIPDLLREADAIERLALQEAIGAIVVDSLSGGHGMKENSAEMRALLKRFAAMAGRLKLPIILVHHTNKRHPLESTAVTLDRVRGSTTITQFCRSVVALYRLEDGDQISPVRVEAIKSTFCAPPPPMGFTITNQGLVFGDAPEPVKDESQIDKACDLLLALLGSGPVASAELQGEADGAGISWDTFKRAKDRLGVVAKRDGRKRKWYWALPANT